MKTNRSVTQMYELSGHQSSESESLQCHLLYHNYLGSGGRSGDVFVGSDSTGGGRSDRIVYESCPGLVTHSSNPKFLRLGIRLKSLT